MKLEVLTRLYKGGIKEDVLLSYAWLVTRSLDVVSARHGFCGHFGAQKIFVPGMHGF